MQLELSSVHSANIEILTKYLLSELDAFNREQIRPEGLFRPNPPIVIPDLDTIRIVESSKGERAAQADGSIITSSDASKMEVPKVDVASILSFLKDTELYALSDREHLRGITNVNYFIFTKTDFPIYTDIDLSTPLYIGRAKQFFKRIGEHQESINAVERFSTFNGIKNIQLSDFYYRFIPVGQFDLADWEKKLIDHFRPQWNKSGFGSKKGYKITSWDRLHPGRHWRPKEGGNVVGISAKVAKKK